MIEMNHAKPIQNNKTSIKRDYKIINIKKVSCHLPKLVLLDSLIVLVGLRTIVKISIY